MRSFRIANEMGIRKLLGMVICVRPLLQLRDFLRGGSFGLTELVEVSLRLDLRSLRLQVCAFLGSNIGLRLRGLRRFRNALKFSLGLQFLLLGGLEVRKQPLSLPVLQVAKLLHAPPGFLKIPEA